MKEKVGSCKLSFMAMAGFYSHMFVRGIQYYFNILPEPTYRLLLSVSVLIMTCCSLWFCYRLIKVKVIYRLLDR